MVEFRIHHVGDVTIIEFVLPELSERSELEDVLWSLHQLPERSAVRKLLLDLTRVRFMSSRALSMLIRMRHMVTAGKGRLTICGLANHLRNLFALARLDKVFEFHATREDALDVLATESANASA